MSRALKAIGFVGLVSAVFSVAALGDITKSFTFPMPACPIPSTTVNPTKMDFTLPRKNPVGVPFSITGTVQVTDQTGGTVLLVAVASDVNVNLDGVTFSRTVKSISHATGSLAFDRGCAATDPYGSNKCTWQWDESVTAAYQGLLQEDVTSGRLIVDLKVNDTIPFGFTCPVCGAYCTVAIPKQVAEGRWDKLWQLMIELLQFPFSLTNPAASH